MRHRLFILAACLSAIFSSCAEKGDIDAADLLACGTFDPQTQICDKRDGNVYKFVKIDAQIWLAENLKYETHSSACYENDPENCQKYGRLYLWNNENNKKLCPEGWHIPSDSEWKILEEQATDDDLKARTDWDSYLDLNGNEISGNGDDTYGFTALPGGVYKFEFKKCSEIDKDESGIPMLSEWLGLGSATAFMSSVAKYSRAILSNDALDPCVAVNSLVSVRCIKN
ncbi:hypothetical protein R83H12_01367 [Fibrobacteria bacterium R8-3-H12]